MTYNNFLKTTALTLASLSVTATAYANDAPLWPKKPYSADMSIQSDNQTMTGKFYLDGPNMRVELDTPQGLTIQIIDRDSGDATMLTNSAGRKMAIKVNAAQALSAMPMPTRDTLPKPTGTKRVDRKKCKIYRIDDDKICITKDYITLEAVNEQTGAMTTFSNVKIAKQKSALFIVPSDYQVMDMSGFGGMMGGAGDNASGSAGGMLDALLGSAMRSGDGVDGGGDTSGEIPGGLMESIMAIANSDDDAAAEDAALDGLLGGLGIPKGMITRNSTTSGVLMEGLDGMVFENDTERQKALDLAEENRRLAAILEKDGMEGLWRDAGMSEAQIIKMRESQSEFSNKLDQHVQKHSGTAMDAANTYVDPRTLSDAVDLEKEIDAMNARAEALAADGNISAADRAQLQREAEQKLERLLGQLPRK